MLNDDHDTVSSPAEGSAPEHPALESSVELARFAYEDYDRSIESLNTRAGVSLTLVVTLALTLGLRLEALPVEVFGPLWLAGLVAHLTALVTVGVGAVYLARAFLTHKIRAAYSMEELARDEWHKPREEFFKKQLANFVEAVTDKNSAAARKARLYNRGVIWTLVGAALFLLAEVTAALVVIGEKYGW